jgi:pyruvate dehydrogenase E2 component (dihydrolipoamide acetyltransferase)
MAQLELTVPDLGGFDAIPIIEILVKAGETIAKDTPLVTLESDKATMEVPASMGGVVKDIRVKLGDKVSAGTVLLTVESSDVAAAATPPAIASKDAVGAVASEAGAAMEAAASAPPAAGSSSIAPSATNGTTATNGAFNGASNGVAPSSVSTSSASTNGPVHASPGIRRFARELGVSLSGVRGSGPNGRVTRDDVQGYVKRALAGGTNGATAAASGFGLGLPAWPVVDFAKFGPIERVALSRIQKISGPALARNWVMIPHVTQNEDADVTELEAFRKQINGERKDVKVTMLAFLMKAAVAALKRFPQVNASLDGDALVLKHYYNLGFAADTPTGLVVPVIKNVDTKGVIEIARETSELAAKAREGKLGPAEMSGATFTISSLGSIGGTTFTPIINAPEVAILGACKAEIRPVWDGATFVPRLIQPLSFSYDHRVVDGAAAARFCVEIKTALADLRRTLL